MKILTGNDLPTGDVVWWDGAAWSRHVEEAVDVGAQGEAIARAEEATRRVNVPYVIDAVATPEGPRPAHIKDRVRALGPTVRLDLTLKPADPRSRRPGDLMYQYDQYDQSIVDARVEEFRDQVARRLSGELTEDQFKPLRLMNGLYLQLHAYMLRVAIPYGTLDSRQMRMLAHIARKYDRDYGHFTTRQNLQYNWIKLEDAPDILADLATVEMHAIQTSGNCIRNISSDQFAGAAADEVADPRVWAELLRQWSTFHPEFSYLPRKFKIAVIASDADRAAMRLHDIGIQLVVRDGELGGRVFVGGGMGRTPMIAPEIKDFITAADLLSYLEACLRVYNRYGRRDNIYKARIKILVHEIGADEYRRQVEEEFVAVKALGLDPPQAEFDRIAAFFAAPAFETRRRRHARPFRPGLRAFGSTRTSRRTSSRATPWSPSA